MTDPVTLAVVRGALEQIADEMDLHLIHAAISPIISETNDCAHGIFHPDVRRDDRAGALRAAGVPRQHAVHRHQHHQAGRAGGRLQAGRSVDRQRSLCQRHASAGHRAGVALLRRRRTVRAAREHRPLDGHRRQRAGRLGAEGDRDPSGRHHHPADEALRRRQAERAAGEDVHQQCAPAGPDRGRSLGDVQRVQCRPARARHAARALRTREARRLHRRNDGPLGSADALLHRGDPGRRLSVRGLLRQ